MSHFQVSVKGEPSPKLVDSVVNEFRERSIEVVVALGGGSVIDAGKAISAMLLLDRPVGDYLEGVGSGERHSGEKIPFIAVPTTAGTGSEATKNAVLSDVGPKGFKKSLRHDNFVPDIAVIDPELTLSCPPEVTAACGMDAFSQLLESYVSTNASPMTDALAVSGLEYIRRDLIRVCTDSAKDVDARAGMAYAAFLSGITLANAGLGVVHGLASPIGGYFDIPHGIVCGTLIAAANRMTIQKLKEDCGAEHPALRKYAKLGALISGADESNIFLSCEAFVDTIEGWLDILGIPKLGTYGIKKPDVGNIVAGAGSKNNPIPLAADEIRSIVESRL